MDDVKLGKQRRIEVHKRRDLRKIRKMRDARIAQGATYALPMWTKRDLIKCLQTACINLNLKLSICDSCRTLLEYRRVLARLSSFWNVNVIAAALIDAKVMKLRNEQLVKLKTYTLTHCSECGSTDITYDNCKKKGKEVCCIVCGKSSRPFARTSFHRIRHFFKDPSRELPSSYKFK